MAALRWRGWEIVRGLLVTVRDRKWLEVPPSKSRVEGQEDRRTFLGLTPGRLGGAGGSREGFAMLRFDWCEALESAFSDPKARGIRGGGQVMLVEEELIVCEK